MLSKEKIRLMAALAIYEKNGGSEELKIAEHYRYDYVMTQLFSSFIRYTVSFGICLGLYLVFNANKFFYNINAGGFIRTVRRFGLFYLAGLFAYFLITLAVYIVRHRNAVKGTEMYASGLRQLDKRFYSRKSRRE